MRMKLLKCASWIAFLVSAISEWGLDVDLPLSPALWLGMAAVVFFATNASAAFTTNSWTDSSGKWEMAGNWSLNVPPSTNGQSAVLITNAGNNTVTVDATTVLSNAINGCLTISNLAISANTLILSNAAPGAPLQMPGILSIGTVANATGSVVIAGGQLQMLGPNGSISIGNGGPGQMTVSGSVNVVECSVGFPAGSPGTLTMNGGSMTAGEMVIGRSSTGTVWVTGGELNVTPGSVEVGYISAGRMIVSNGTVRSPVVNVAANLNGETGTLTIAGGTHSIDSLFVGDSFGSTGVVWLTGGVLSNGLTIIGNSLGGARMTVSNGIVVGRTFFIGEETSDASLTIAGGSVIASNVNIGTFFGTSIPSNNILRVDSGSLFVTNALGTGRLRVGVAGGKASLILNGGSVTVDALLATNSANSVVTINGGTLTAHSAFVTNGVSFDLGTNATYVATGGTHGFDNDIRVGNIGAANQLIVTNGARVSNGAGYLGADTFSSNNVAVVTGTGSVWSNSARLTVGNGGPGNQLTVTDGGAVYNSDGFLGTFSSSSNNSVRVAGNATWRNTGALQVGFFASSNTLTIAGGLVTASNAFIGVVGNSILGIASNNVIRVDSGSLFVTNALGIGALVVGVAGGKASLILNGGSVTVDRLVVTNGVNSVVTFNAGTINVMGTTVNNNQQFVVGDGVNPATYHLVASLHTFNNGLRIRNAATLTGCSAITGVVVVDAGGTVVSGCGALEFFGSITNNGTIRVLNGTILEADSPVVNNGIIDFIFGGTNFHSGLINNGILLDANSDYDGDGQSNLQEALAGTDPTNSTSAFRITGITKVSTNLMVTWMMGPGKTNALERTTGITGNFATNNFVAIFTVTNTLGSVTNYLDIGAATNLPSLYYRVRLVR